MITVGLFSFLTGNRTDERDASDWSGSRAENSENPVPTPSPRAPGVEGQASSGTPFTPPDAWNVDALLTPPPAPTGETPEIGPVDPAQTAALQGKIIEVLKTVYDPEIPVDIYELGLIYEILVDAERRVLVRMTLTSPACPSAQQIPSEVRYKVKAIPEVTDAWVEIVWEPPWDKDRMSEAARLQLGFF
jgi:FeS assembly SUF system protein